MTTACIGFVGGPCGGRSRPLETLPESRDRCDLRRPKVDLSSASRAILGTGAVLLREGQIGRAGSSSCPHNARSRVRTSPPHPSGRYGCCAALLAMSESLNCLDPAACAVLGSAASIMAACAARQGPRWFRTRPRTRVDPIEHETVGIGMKFLPFAALTTRCAPAHRLARQPHSRQEMA